MLRLIDRKFPTGLITKVRRLHILCIGMMLALRKKLFTYAG